MRLVTLVLAVVAISAMTCSADRVPMYGVNHEFIWTPDADIPGLIQAMKDAHVRIVRVPMRWTVVEPEKGKWDFSKMDRVVRDIRAAKIEVLALLVGVPAWASGVDPNNVEGWWDCYPPKKIEEYAEYIRRCVRRYKNHIRYWEIWNEENGQDFYRPMPDSGEYVWLLKAAHNAIKSADPKATVVLGGLQFDGIIHNRWSSVRIENFLQKIYHAGGRAYFDVVNTHPYALASSEEGPEYVARLVRNTIAVMCKNGDGAKPLWITETGLATGNGVTEEMQAEHLAGIYRELGKIPQVKSIYWFTLRDYPRTVCGGEDTMGLITVGGRRKPAFEAYKKLAGKAAK